MSNLQSTHNQAENQALSWFPGFGKSQYAGAVMGYIFHAGRRHECVPVHVSPGELYLRFGCAFDAGAKIITRFKREGLIVRHDKHRVRMTREGLSRIEQSRPVWYEPIEHSAPLTLTPKMAAAIAAVEGTNTRSGAAKIMGMSARKLYDLIRRAYLNGCPECGYYVTAGMKECPSCGKPNSTFNSRAAKQEKTDRRSELYRQKVRRLEERTEDKDKGAHAQEGKQRSTDVRIQARRVLDAGGSCDGDPANLQIADVMAASADKRR